MPKQLYHFTHSSPEITTLADLLRYSSSPAYLYNRDHEGFLKIVGDDKLTNRQRIEATYTLPGDPAVNAPISKMTVKVGTLFYIEYEKVNQPSFLTEGIEVISSDEPAFKAAKLAELEADKGYHQVNKVIKGQYQYGTSQEHYPDVTVWIWCRSLSPSSDEDNELKGQFFNLSPFIENLTTHSSKNGGKFQIKLPPLVCEIDDSNKWVIRRGTLDQYKTDNNTSLQGDGYLAQSSIFHSESLVENPNKSDDEVLTRSQMLFHNIIGSNDLVFIRLETLKMEKEQRYEDSQEFHISKDLIAGRIYDMIGLVDYNTQTVTPSNNDVSINIGGRDLSKLLAEDGSYFNSLENSGGILKFAGQATIKNSLITRLFADNGMQFIGLYQFNSIEYILKFIIQQLSLIKIVPDDLFSSYKSTQIINGVEKEVDRRNHTFTDFNVTAKDKLTDKKFKEKLSAGIWQIIDLVIDKTVANRRMADSSFSMANGSLMSFIQSAIQMPLCEFYMDTYGDKYHLIVRRPPYDQKGLISLIEGKVNTQDGIPSTPPAIVDVLPEDVLQESLTFDDSQVYSWYQFYPRNAIMGNEQDYALSYLPAIFFEEYAEVWGNKPFQQSNTYVPYVSLADKGGLGIQEQQAFEDLKYVIESNQYLPFTRKGSLTLNRDRRLKIGNILRYKSTGEIFFIESVQHSFSISENSIEAITIVQVTRGMIEQFIYGTNVLDGKGNSRWVSYFNIIDTRLNYDKVAVKTPLFKTVKKKVEPLVQTITQDAVTPRTPNMFVIADFIQGYQVVSNGGNVGIGKLQTYNQFPAHKSIFTNFINKINQAGYWVDITDAGDRSISDQLKYSRRKGEKNAKPGTSKHGVNRGAAIDINLIDKRTGLYTKKHDSTDKWISSGVVEIAKSIGLKWGGYFNDYPDRVHFEIPTTTIESIQALQPDIEYAVPNGFKTEMVIKKEAVFQNFKVNKFSFNFFLKRLQNKGEFRNATNRTTDEKIGTLLRNIF